MRPLLFSTSGAAMAALLLVGCAIGPPPVSPTPDRLSPLSVADVIKFLNEGISEAAILFKIRADGIESRPTIPQIADLRAAGAGENFIQELLAAEVPSGDGRPSLLEEQTTPFPDLWPAYGWTWSQGRWHLVPWFTGRPRPD